MPTDDDYGRRERLLLHQHATSQYESQSPSPAPGSVGGSSSGSSAGQVAPGTQQDRSTGTGSSNVQERVTEHVESSYGGRTCAEKPDENNRGQYVASHQYQRQNGPGERYCRYVQDKPESCSSMESSRFQQVDVRPDGDYTSAPGMLSTSTSNPFSSETFPSPPSPAPANDRFIPPPPLSPTPSEKYASSQSLAGFGSADRMLPPGSPGARDRFGTAPASPMPSSKDRFASAERLLVNASPIHEPKDQQRYSATSCGSPIMAALQSDRSFVSSKDSGSCRYAISTDRLLSSSPIHAPVPERFASKSERFLAESSIHERYLRQDPGHHERFSTISSTERFLSSSPNPEGAHQRYSSTERVLVPSSAADQSSQTQRRFSSTETRGIESLCGKYSQERSERCSSSSPAPSEYAARFAAFQDSLASQQRFVTADRYADLQRYGPSRGVPDRFVSTERFLAVSSPGHDRLGTNVSTENRYSTSSERLLSSASPSSETGRYHVSTGTNDRFSLSPTPEANISRFGQNGSKVSEKYLAVSKSIQSYNTGDRYQDQFDRTNHQERYNRDSGLDRFSSQDPRFSGNDRFHGNPERYSPARSTADKYLSLPKPKDRFSSAGRIVSTSSASYVPPTAHTPVERYVPQPPPEILYPERYVDRYVPPAAHTPTDRYVPAADPGDPYMRRDLGFHHHYRLPPPGYPYHQSHYRFRGFAYASPGRLGGSPGSSSSSSSTSAQREFATSPLLRPKVRTTPVEFNTGRHMTTGSTPVCCTEAAATPNHRVCCAPVRRSMPPEALPSIPTQTSHSSWQPSPSSGTTGTSTVSSTGPDVETTSQSIGMYPVGVGSAATSTETPTTPPITTTPPVPLTTTGGLTGIGTIVNPNLVRSVSAPMAPRPVMQPTMSSVSASATRRPRLRRNMSRTEAVRNYIKRETATFFGVDEESEALERQRWLGRRRRMASRKYGALLPEHRPPDPDITRDVPDSTEIPEGVVLRRWQQPVRRKDSVARMTLSGLHYMVETLTRQRPRERSQIYPESRSFPVSAISMVPKTSSSSTDAGLNEEESFFERPPPPPPPPTPPSQSSVQQDTAASGTTVKDEEVTDTVSDLLDAPVSSDRETSEELVRFTTPKDDRTSIEQQIRRPRAISRDHYTSRPGYRTSSWRRSRDVLGPEDEVTGGLQYDEPVNLRRDINGATRISPSTIDRVFDNSNRRQYGMGIVGRFFGRSFRKSVAHKPDVKKQLDDIEDHRPYFTYWITTVQVLILIISLACYGFGPVGINLNHRSGLVLVTSLSLQQVDYQEPANFWIGPRAADLIHLGAKFAPCMRRDIKILKEIDVWRERERDTACCIRNDDSGCVQSSKADCSVRGLRSTVTNTISTWKKWGPGDNGPGGRISGSVCGLDPKFCDAPASIAPYEWPDDITKWPICRKTNPFSQRFSSKDGVQQGNNNFPVGRYKDKMAEHMVCEVIGHPCCIGIHGMCRITTKEYCDFVHGYFHEEASLCSQVECLHDVCGMIPFLHPEWPDQFYRLFTTMFLHAGILHLAITLLVQYFLMRDLEKLTGSLRIALIYFVGALAGNLASAIFVPYRAEVGPAGAHFALLATLVVEVLHCWPMLKHPRRALMKLIMILLGLLILGVLPWIDNYAHLFGFIFGFLAAYALMPFISFGHYDRRRKILLIWVCMILIVGLFALLLTLFYNVPVYECEVCKLFNCVPFTRDFCASQNINFKREEPV
ncbi:inactive rhomboid protein 1 isoform X3 [Cephus cinctus]|uniref:Inactive rhomboid protein 1 isoform X3 n=1 Tax=Cephus cinctus TaxID=211228 RepID=A0AAJ7RH53_CEPCN|nr:inactive rhomboid protein 1 isoform X3 [Cephus cinctus]